jgi:Asp-tRNA(Asn)/Glu-tRNA(Gln) amidotransferase A subunit family amidase
MTDLSLAELAAEYRAGRMSPIEATEQCLERIARLDPELHAFITVTPELARAQAKLAADELASGLDRGPLHGVPIGLKDLIDTAGVRTTCGSALFEHRVPGEDATVAARLAEAGAVLLGKLNMHEHAYGGSGVIGHWSPSRNPRNRAHICGGSSSGSAAAVGAGLCYAALGSDTAGSIRLPAALCGIVGFKPSYGLVPLRGVFPLAWTYDHVGPMTRTVEDAALVLQAIAGLDAEDFTSAPLPRVDYAAALADPPARRIGVARTYFFADVDPDVLAAVEAALARLAALGHTLHQIDVPIDDDRTVARTESWVIHRHHVAATPERYQPATLQRIRSGEATAAADYVEKLHALHLLRRHTSRLFTDVDLIVTPTSPIPAPSFAELAAAPDSLRPRELVMLRNTRPFNVRGNPAISIPCGVTRAGLPVGLQIAGPYGADAAVLQLAAQFERG